MAPRFPWKQNFRKPPPSIEKALAAINTDFVVVAATKKVPTVAIDKGTYRHLGLRRDGADIVAGDPAVPKASVGRYSDRNVNGWEIVLKDEPMITKSYSWETPNFGDAATYGTHTHYQDREVYQRRFFEPRHLPIAVEILKQPDDGTGTALIKFSVECILDRNREDFADDLLFCLNLLQENTGVAGVYASNATREDFIGTIALDWEVFPPGTAAEVVKAFTSGHGMAIKPSGELTSRIKLFSSLKPKAFLRGSGSFGAYVGAQFADDLVVFENLNYGNALYVLYQNWADISKRSRLDLLKGTTKDFDRFPHTDGWEDRFTEHMRQELDSKK